MMEVLPEPGAPYCRYGCHQNWEGSHARGQTNQEVTSAEWDSALGVPTPALQKLPGVVHKQVLDARFKNDGAEGTFGTGGYMTPFIVSRI